MRYLVVLPGSLPFPPIMGGATENLVNYYVESNEISKKNEYIVVSAYNKCLKDYHIQFDNCKLIYINQRKIFFMIKKLFLYIIRRFCKMNVPNAYLSSVLKQIKKESFESIIIENNPEYGFYIKKKYPNIKLYLHLHNDSISISNIKYAKSYDRILCVSNYIKERILSLDNSMDAVTLYNAIDLKNYSNKKNNRQSICKKFGLSTTKKTIMYVGRIQENKGVLDLVKAFVNVDNNNLQLVLVGGSFFKNSKPDQFYKTICDISEKYDNIVMTGYVDYNSIPELMQCSDIGVVPSKCKEAFGLTLLEFMALGKPTITSNDGALTELANDNTSIIIDCEDDMQKQLEKAIIDLCYNSSEQRLKKMGQEAMKKSKGFGVDKYVKKFNEYVGD